MADQFRGRFEAKMDEKGRVSLPNSFKQALPTKEKQMVITNGYSNGFQFLDVYTLASWKKLEKKINSLNSLKIEVQNFQRFYLSGGQVLVPDKTGRVLIPNTLRKYANVVSEILFVGMGEKFEIWPKKQWEKLYGTLTNNFDTTLKEISHLEDNK